MKQVAYAIGVSITEQQRRDLFGDTRLAVVEISPEEADGILSWHWREIGKSDYIVKMILASPEQMDIAHAFRIPCPNVKLMELEHATPLLAVA